MPEQQTAVGTGSQPARGNRSHRSLRLPTRAALIQGAVLIGLALGSGLLMNRRDSIDRSKQIARQAGIRTDLIAHAAQPSSSSWEESARLLRILECGARAGDILAGAVIDSSGTVVAHTSLSQIGTRVETPGHMSSSPGESQSGLIERLFDGSPGKFMMRPLLDSEGETGTLALLLPLYNPAYNAGQLFLYLLPAGLVLLAFLAVNQSTMRSALKPAAESFTRLAGAVDWKIDPEQGDPGADAGYNQVVQDTVARIHALTQSNDELTLTNRLFRFENNRMKMILDHFPDGLIVMDILNKTAFMNKRAIRVLGLNPDDEKTWSPQEPPVEVLRTIREIDKAGQLVIPVGGEESQRQILCSRIPLTTSGGKTMGTLYAMRDVTAQNSAVKTQAEFLSQVTHELKAPLNTILSHADLLADGNELQSEDRKEFYNTLTSETHRMGQLIGNLLQLSRIQMGNLTAQFNLVKPGSLTKSLAESLKIQADDNGQRLDISVPENLPSIRGDKDLLGVAINNLLSNALKYTPEGGRISVRATEEDQGVIFEIKDTGIGIPDEALPHIFDRFYRSEQELVQMRPGSGLGLSLVKEIVELHNGRITVESTAKSGTRFLIWLPALEVGSKLNPVGALT